MRRPGAGRAGAGGGGRSGGGGLQREIGKRLPFDLPEQEAYLNLQRSAACLSVPFERLFRAHGLSSGTYNALRILRGHLAREGDDRAGEAKGRAPGMGGAGGAGGAGGGGVPSQTIGEHLIAQVPDVTRLVDRLAERGLVERCRIEDDRRVVMVKITRAGLDLLAKLDKPVRELHAAQLGHMGRRELAQLSRLLEKARAASQ